MTYLILYLAFLVVMPCAASAKVCTDRNRNPTKGVVLTLLVAVLTAVWLAWLVPVGLWLALRKRNEATGMLM